MARAKPLGIRDKGMRVFSMQDPKQPMHEVDLFVEHLVPFEGLWTRSEVIALTTTTVRVASIPDRDVSWEGHHLHQLTFGLAATPAQRLAWLEEMIALAHQTGALPRRRHE